MRANPHLHILLCLSLSLAAAEPLSLKMLVKPRNYGPCLTSLVGPPLSTENCQEWNGNIDGAPTFDPARRLIFVGAGDNYLHAIDADTGASFAHIEAGGRVITETIFDKSRTVFYVGTDKSHIKAYDAFSFKNLFSFQADSRINNDLILVGDKLVFSTGLATVYALDALTGVEKWHQDRPLASDRLKLSAQSNTISLVEDSVNMLAVPHPDGFVSLLIADTGKTKRQLSLSPLSGAQVFFPDIVAPMLELDGSLWVASFGRGIFVFDIKSGQINNHLILDEIQQLALNGNKIFAASSKALYRLNLDGSIVWQNNFQYLKTLPAKYGFPFTGMEYTTNRVFMGLPSRLIFFGDSVVMASSLGAIGLFDGDNGRLIQVLGNALGFSPKISVSNDGVLLLTRFGTVAQFR